MNNFKTNYYNNLETYRRLKKFWSLKKFSKKLGHWTQVKLAEKHIEILKQEHPYLNFFARIFS